MRENLAYGSTPRSNYLIRAAFSSFFLERSRVPKLLSADRQDNQAVVRSFVRSTGVLNQDFDIIPCVKWPRRRMLLVAFNSGQSGVRMGPS